MIRKILTYDPRKAKTVITGKYDEGTKTFNKEVSSKHFHKITQSYAIQEDVIHRLKELGCERVVIKTPTSQLKSKFIDWLDKEIKVLDYGWGKQRFMPVKRMSKI